MTKQDFRFAFVSNSQIIAQRVLDNLNAWLEDKLTPGTIRADNACVYMVSARPVELAA